MQFIDYLSNSEHIYNKSNCPKDCGFQSNKKIPIVGIAPPQAPEKILGMIISRDPTTRFINNYLSARSETSYLWNKTLMNVQAPPQWLINKIKTFNDKYMDGKHTDDTTIFEKILVNNFYWTHLHKCCTDKNEKDFDALMFKSSNGTLCANTWLLNEITDAKNSGARIMICLGKDVEAFIQPLKSTISGQGYEIFYLPHPSSANNGKWYPKEANEKEALIGKLENLFLACRTVGTSMNDDD